MCWTWVGSPRRLEMTNSVDIVLYHKVSIYGFILNKCPLCWTWVGGPNRLEGDNGKCGT